MKLDLPAIAEWNAANRRAMDDYARGDCLITVYDVNAHTCRGEPRTFMTPRRCGEPVARGGLCAHHADDRDRLAAP